MKRGADGGYSHPPKPKPPPLKCAACGVMQRDDGTPNFIVSAPPGPTVLCESCWEEREA